MPARKAPQYIIDALDRLDRRAAKMEKCHFGTDQVTYDKWGVGEVTTSLDELVKQKTYCWRRSWIEPDLDLVRRWARGERIDPDDRGGAT